MAPNGYTKPKYEYSTDNRTIIGLAEPPLASSAVLACGHPGLPNNLKGGKCGTCWMVTDLERMAKKTSTPKLRRLLRSLANQFRSGNVLYDTNGKSFLEWEKTMRPQANVEPSQAANL